MTVAVAGMPAVPPKETTMKTSKISLGSRKPSSAIGIWMSMLVSADSKVTLADRSSPVNV